MQVDCNRATGVIKQFRSKEIANKLMSMGILPGMDMEIIRKSPFGGSLYIKVGGRLLALRNEEYLEIVLK